MDFTTSQSRRPITVFHLDDSPEQLELAKICLEKLDPSMKVTSLKSSSVLLRELSTRPCDCIIASHRIDGTTIGIMAPKIRRITEAPIILYTGHEKDEVKEVMASNSIEYFVEKQGDLDHYEVLLSTIRLAVERFREAKATP